MAVGEEKNKKDESKGFAGLSSLVSDTDTLLPPAAKKEPTNTAGASSTIPPSASSQTTPPPQPTRQQTHQEPSQPASGSSGGNWVLGIAAAIGILWLIGQSNQTTSSQAPTYSPPTQSAAPSYSPPMQPQEPSRPTESKPPLGQNLVLSKAQIRYCLAEDIRMDGAKNALNNYNDADVMRFNAMVDDYNSRCSDFRYKRGALESARQDIEQYRSQLQAEGRSRFAGGLSTSFQTAPTSPRTVPDATVRAIQLKLNELGYEAGSADGLMGQSTHSAILAYQKDSGLHTDGTPSPELLQLLSASGHPGSRDPQQPTHSTVVSPTTSSPSLQPPTRQDSPSAANNSIPQNARLNYLGNDWECNHGYFKYGNGCRAVQVPQNGKITYLGNDWECNRGYYKYGNECRAVQVPQNGKITYLGNDWECNRGYFKYGNECRAVQVPQNGKITYLGNDWECERGYQKNGDKCIPIFQP